MSEDAAQDPEVVIGDDVPMAESEALAVFKTAARAYKAAADAYRKATDEYAAAIKRLGEEAIK